MPIRVPKPGNERIASRPPTKLMRSRMPDQPQSGTNVVGWGEADHRSPRSAARLPSATHSTGSHIGRTAVFDDVAQPLLHDPKQAERQIRWELGRQGVVHEIHLQAVLLRHIGAQRANRLDETQRFQLERVQTMRERVDVARDGGDALTRCRAPTMAPPRRPVSSGLPRSTATPVSGSRRRGAHEPTACARAPARR